MRYYNLQRQNSVDNNVNKVTVRSLESLFRLSEAHARLMYRSEVILEVCCSHLCFCSLNLLVIIGRYYCYLYK